MAIRHAAFCTVLALVFAIAPLASLGQSSSGELSRGVASLETYHAPRFNLTLEDYTANGQFDSKILSPFRRLQLRIEPATELGIPFSVEKAMILDAVKGMWSDRPRSLSETWEIQPLLPKLSAPLQLNDESDFSFEELK